MTHNFRKARRFAPALAFCAAGAVLSGCSETGEFTLFQQQSSQQDAVTAADNSVKLVERDVEAPDVFQVTDRALWDGRPSLGGVWVAHPDVSEPERVIIRNTANSKFVIGALFRRERETPGPVIQVSSDAAAALDMLAGAPAQLNVTALRREAAPDPSTESDTEAQSAIAGALAAPADVEATALDPVSTAAAAIDAAEAAAEQPAARDVAPQTPPETTPVAAPARAALSLEKPYIQIGIFSVEQNARNTAVAMRQSGMIPTVKEQSSQGKTFWRVIVGPATSTSERGALLKKIKDVGFDDAYPVTN
ncbi:MAG: SPOR domain-containing protein [Rhodobacteraceae bacterium]|nr:SPOR domain-containing protein [Paracoccaceae bacterium]